MTTISDLITDAYRQGNLIALGVTPSVPQQEEALRHLDRIVQGVFGAEVGDPLTALPLGRQNISRPSGYPPWGDDPGGDWFVPKNTRLILNLDRDVSVYLPPNPDDGCRFAVNDTSGTLGTVTLTVHGNGRNVEGSPTLALDEASLNREWFFREDLGTWVRSTPLSIDADMPLPSKFDDFFITMLAIRLNPAYGVALDAQSQAGLERARTLMRAQYKQRMPTRPPIELSRLPNVTRDRGDYYDERWGQPNLGDLGRTLWHG